MDRIEGIFINKNEEIYELAGSCSYWTKEFEIIGMTKDKKKSLKIRGHLNGFKL